MLEAIKKQVSLLGGDTSHMSCNLQDKDGGERPSIAVGLVCKRHGDIKGSDVFEEKIRKKCGWSIH